MRTLQNLGLFLVLSTSVTANTVVPTRLGPGGAADLLSVTRPPTELVTPSSDASKVTFSCSDTQSGKTIQRGEAGFDQCMSGIKSDKKAQVGFKIGESK